MPSRREKARLAGLKLVAHMTSPFINRGPSPEQPLGERPRILLIRPDHIGDLLFTTPALRFLRGRLPNAHIALMVGPWAEAVVRNNPHLDEIITCQFPGFTRRPKGSFFAPYRKLLRMLPSLRERAFDLAINLRFDFWWGALLIYLAGIPQRIGFDIAECRPFLTARVPYKGIKHEVERNIALVAEAVGEREAEQVPGPLEFSPTEEDRCFAESYLKARGVGEGELLVCIHPGAGAPVKLWREEGFARVAQALMQEKSAKVILTGSEAERKLAEGIARQMTDQPIICLGETTLGQLAAIMRRSALVIGVDSGPLHLAVALHVPTVHLFGPVDERSFGPWGDRARHIVLTSQMPCIPCNRLDYAPDELDEHPCVRAIAEEEVLAAAKSLLQA